MSFMQRVATGIVNKRKFIFFIFAALAVFSIFSSKWVKTNEDLMKYLSEKTEARQGLDIMEKEFSEYITAQVMVANVTYETAATLLPLIKNVAGVHAVEFKDSPDHYKDSSALFFVVFKPGNTAAQTEEAQAEIKSRLSAYDTYIKSGNGFPTQDIMKKEMTIVMAIAAVIVFSVLLLTSQTYMEIPVLLITFGMAALLNVGTNFIFGTISYITKSICVILQLALAVDYAIILCHRYTEERKSNEPREAVIAALGPAISEIAASSLTTIAGLVALTLMQFKLGADIGIVLIKAIFISMFCVIFLMPGLLLLFSKAIDRTHHRNFIKDISGWGKFVIKTRYIIPAVFVVVVIAAFVFSNRCPYVYGYSTLDTIKQNEMKTAQKLIDKTFGVENLTALVIPSGDYDKEAALLNDLSAYSEIKSAMGLANIPAIGGYTLTSKINPRQFSDIANIAYDESRALYTGYAVSDKQYGKIVSNLDDYAVPLIDIFTYLYQQKQAGFIKLDRENDAKVNELYEELSYGRKQLEGKSYSRMLIYMNLPEESPETFKFLETIRSVTTKYYSEAYIVGNSLNNKEMKDAFSNDNVMISILSALFVFIVLVINLRSVGLPMLLLLCIQASIWINFSVPFLTGKNLFFISYLIVSAIQMGANVDYAIIISTRYLDLKTKMPIREAMIKALNQAFPTIITSGSMMSSAGLIIGFLTSDNTVSSIGFCLGRGTIISLIIVMGVLPQILLLGDILIEKTGFSIKRPVRTEADQISIVLNGRVKGHISGYIDADVRGSFKGSVSAVLEMGEAESEIELLEPPEEL